MYKDESCCPTCGDELAVAKMPPMTEVIGKTSIMLADEVCMAREILVLLEGGKTEPPPPSNPTCLRDDAMSMLDKAHTLYNVLNQIKSALGG